MPKDRTFLYSYNNLLGRTEMSNATLVAQVREILMREWDPIEVNWNPALSDEYDEHIPVLIKMLSAGANASRVANYLGTWERNIGMPRNSESTLMAIAQRLCQLAGVNGAA